MDRKNQTFLTRVSDAQKNLLDLKSTQFIGADTTEILVYQSGASYDVDFTLNDGDRAYVYLTWEWDTLKPWQPTCYNELYYNVYIADPGPGTASLYNGNFANVLPTEFLDTLFSATITLQIVNTAGAAKHFFIKPYALTTAQSGTLYSSWNT